MGGARVQERVIGPALEQPRHGPERSNVRGKISGGGQQQTRIVAAHIGYRVTKRRQVGENRDTDGANSVPS
jgi:hypothetical protein